MTATRAAGHARWVRVTHAIVTLAVAALVFSGVEILMVHPRLYWGEAGNDLTTPLLELPISRNYKHGGWTTPVAFAAAGDGVVTASRTYEIFNQNGWGRSLHFLAAWVLVACGLVYWLLGLGGGHVRRNLLPETAQLSAAHAQREIADHLRLRLPPATGGPHYGLLQRVAYLIVVFVALPLIAVTGLTMSPAISAGFPVLLDLTGGHQTARTLHFAGFVTVALFVAVHLVMVAVSGFRRQVRAITVGGS